MKAKIVVGLGFGDEGKGITTDYLVSQKCIPSNTVVVRFSGGHQASHTVIVNGVKHIFSNYCSGGLRDATSYISEHCCFYPVYILRECDVLMKKYPGVPKLGIHPLAKLTTPYDIAYNRLREKRLSHGSVGVGIGATMQRNQGPYKIHAIDLTNRSILEQKLDQVKKYYQSEALYQYSAKELKYYEETVEFEFKFFYESIEGLVPFWVVGYDFIQDFEHVVFEGSQGILLDMDFGVFPNVTYGNTSSKNAIEICKSLSISDIDMYYVTRCYLTRHGNGWMPNQQQIELVNNGDEINVTNEWQGSLRIGELDRDLIKYALDCDDIYSHGHDKHLVYTCLDQRPGYQPKIPDLVNIQTLLGSFSSDSKDFKTLFSHY